MKKVAILLLLVLTISVFAAPPNGGELVEPSNQPVEQGYCLLKVYASNDLAKEGNVYLNGQEMGNLSKGILVIYDIAVGEYNLVVDGKQMKRIEKEITLYNEYEIKHIEVEPEYSSRWMRIDTNPIGAKVFIDGEEQEEESPLHIELQVGREYEIETFIKNYGKQKNIIFISEKGELFRCNIPINNEIAPEVFMMSPSNNATELKEGNIILNWECIDPDSQEITYDVYIGREPESLKLVSEKQSDKSYIPTEALNNGTKYYWRVEAHDGIYDIQSEIWEFETVDNIFADSFEGGHLDESFWKLGGDVIPSLQNREMSEGNYAIQFGNIDDYQVSYVQLDINLLSDAVVSFYSKVSSEYADYLYFYIDDNREDYWSGNRGWSQNAYDMKAGSHTLKWTYEKDSYTSSYDDTAWIDNVEIKVMRSYY